MATIPPGDAPDIPLNPQEVGDSDGWWSQEWYPWLFQHLILSYANTAARDAELTGLSSTERAFAYVEDSKTLWRWSGTAWVLAAPWVQTGSFAVGAIAGSGGGTTQAVTFTTAFPSTSYTVAFELPSTRLNANAVSKTTSGFTAGVNNFTSSGTSSGTIRWTATYAP